MSKLRVGVVGVGYLGKFHAEKYAAMEDVELVGVVDVNPKAGEEVAGRLGTDFYSDYRDLIGKIDAVNVVVPTTKHFEVASFFLEKGVDVLLEKPMTSTIDEAVQLNKIAEEKNLIIQVGHLERFNPAILAMEKHITAPMFIESHRIHMFKNRGIDVDVVLDLMIHDIDVIMSIVKSPIKTVQAVGVPVVTPTTDIANVRIIFQNGCTANVTVSRISKDNIRRIRIFQPRSFIAVDYANKEMTVITLKDQPGEDGLPQEEVIHSCFIEKDALQIELRDFVNNVKNRTRPRVSGEEGLRALTVALDIMNQIQEHIDSYDHFFKGQP